MVISFEPKPELRRLDRANRNIIEKQLREKYDRGGRLYDGDAATLDSLSLSTSKREQLTIWDDDLRRQIDYQCQRHGIEETVYGAIFFSNVEQALAIRTLVGGRFVIVVFTGLLTAKRFRLFNLCSSPLIASLLDIEPFSRVDGRYPNTKKAFSEFGLNSPLVRPGSVPSIVQLADHFSNHWITLHELGHILGGHLGLQGVIRDEGTVSDSRSKQLAEHAKEMEADRFAIRNLTEMAMNAPLPTSSPHQEKEVDEAKRRLLAFLAFYIVVRGFDTKADAFENPFGQPHPPAITRAHLGFQSMWIYHARFDEASKKELAMELGANLRIFEEAIAELAGCPVASDIIRFPSKEYTDELAKGRKLIGDRLSGKRLWKPFAD